MTVECVTRLGLMQAILSGHIAYFFESSSPEKSPKSMPKILQIALMSFRNLNKNQSTTASNAKKITTAPATTISFNVSMSRHSAMVARSAFIGGSMEESAVQVVP